MLRHPVTFNQNQRLTQLLTDLGCSQTDIQQYMPTPSEVSAALVKRATLATAAAAANSVTVDRDQPSTSAARGAEKGRKLLESKDCGISKY
jgi:hypothetical protein